MLWENDVLGGMGLTAQEAAGGGGEGAGDPGAARLAGRVSFSLSVQPRVAADVRACERIPTAACACGHGCLSIVWDTPAVYQGETQLPAIQQQHRWAVGAWARG